MKHYVDLSGVHVLSYHEQGWYIVEDYFVLYIGNIGNRAWGHVKHKVEGSTFYDDVEFPAILVESYIDLINVSDCPVLNFKLVKDYRESEIKALIAPTHPKVIWSYFSA